MADVDISALSIKVEASAAQAESSIDGLAAALGRLNTNSKLTKTINSLENFKASIAKLTGLSAATSGLNSFANAFSGLASMQKLTGLTSAMATLAKFPTIVAGLNPAKLRDFSAAIAPISAAIGKLGDVQKVNSLNSVLNTLKKVPGVTDDLKPELLERFGAAMQRVADAVRPLATEMEKVSQGFSKLPTNIQKAIAANEKLTASNNRAAKSFSLFRSGFLNSIASIGLYTFSIRAVVNVLSSALTNVNSYIESMNLFSVSMGAATEKGREFAQTLQDVLGIDAGEAMRNMGLIQNLTTSFGLASEQAYVLSKNLTQLGYDMASFYNIPVTDSFQKLQSAIAGELEPIRRLGVDLSQARLQQELYALGFDTLVTKLSQADKAILRYIAIIKQTGNAQTDMGRTLNSPANMLRVFNQQITLLGRSIGSLLLPMLNAILPPLIAMTIILREAITAIAAFFGVSLEFPDMSSAAESFGGLGDAVEDAAGGLDDVGSGLDDVKEEIKETAKELAYLIGGFDELNVLPTIVEPKEKAAKQPKAGGAGAGGLGSLLGGIDLPEYDMLANLVESRVQEWVEKLRQPLMEALKIVGAIAAGLLLWKIAPAVIDFVKGLSGVAAEGTLVKALMGIASAFLTIAGGAAIAYGVMDSIINGLSWENMLIILGGMGLLVAGLAISFGGIGAALGLLVGGIALVAVGFADWLGNGKSLEAITAITVGLLAIGGAFAIIVGWPALVVAAVIAAVVAVVMFWDEIVSAFITAWDVVSNFFAGIGTWFYSTVISPILAALSGVFDWVVSNVIQPIVNAFAPIGKALSDVFIYAYAKAIEVFSGVKDAFTAIYTKGAEIFAKITEIVFALGKAFGTYVIQPAINGFTILVNWLKQSFFDPIFGLIKTIAGFVNTYMIQPIWSGLQFIWDKVTWVLDKIASGMRSVGTTVVDFIAGSLKAVINGVLISIEWVVNGFIGLLNGAISLINNIPGVSIATLAPLQIPRLANGGVLTSSQVVLAGEYPGASNNPEIVAPQNIMRETVAEANAAMVIAIVQAIQSLERTVDEKDYTVSISDDAIGASATRYAKANKRVTGLNPLMA